jgi:uncharacterized alkaline shock family protein YloU
MSLWEYIQTHFGYLLEEPYRYYLVAVVVLAVIWFGYRKIVRARRPIVLYRSQGGNVEIARQTLRGLIVGAAHRVRGVEHASCTYDQRGRKLRVKISIHLAGDARLPEVEEELKKRVRAALHQHVGYEPHDVQPINVRVTKIVGDPSPALAEEAVMLEAETLPRYDDEVETELPEGQKPYQRE